MTIHLSDDEKSLINDYASGLGISASEFVHKAVLGRIEDELDLEAWKQAKVEFDADPETVSAADVAKRFL